MDLSNVVRRVGTSNSNRNGSSDIEIYVDQTPDPMIEEILVMMKKGVVLDGMRWGPALGEITDIPHVKETEKKETKKDKKDTLKVDVDEKGGLWSIGRERKNSQEKGKDRSKPCKSISADHQARFHSLDSGILLNSPAFPDHPESPASTPLSATLASITMLAPPTPAQLGSVV